MAIDCSNVPVNITYDCTNPWGQNCTSDKRFHFPSLWKYTQNIQEACPTDARLFIPNGGIASPRNASLTQASCAAIAGSDWTYYPAADIWTRLTAWKFPLFQLVASFPRPPLSRWVDCFVILHLLGDPIDTIKSLLAKMSSCQGMATHWRLKCGELLEKRAEGDEDGDWKALAILTDAYGEWGEDGQAAEALQNGLYENPQHRRVITSAIRETGLALAADRSTKFLPIVVAQAFFIGEVGIAIFKAAAAAGARAFSATVFINVEAHSIAFSALYFWIIPAVFLSSVIGVSQTEAAIPRTLRRFQIDIERLNLPNMMKLPNDCLDKNEERIFNGGIYSWQPQRCTPCRTYFNVIPYSVVILGTATGLTVSALVPPDGWDCRHIGEILLLVAWFLSAQVDVWLNGLWRLNKKDHKKLFWITGTKDLLVTIATMGGVITAQVGVFNRCSCYTLWGKTGLALPERPDVAKTLFDRLNMAYPAFTFTTIGIELIIFPLFICIQYGDALRIFVQRDDEKSNAAWVWKVPKIYRASKARMQNMFSRRSFSAFKARMQNIFSRRVFSRSTATRKGTSAVEQGLSGESQELQQMTQTLSEEPEP